MTLTKACPNLIYQARTIKGLCFLDFFGIGVHVLSNKTPRHFCSTLEQKVEDEQPKTFTKNDAYPKTLKTK